MIIIGYPGVGKTTVAKDDYRFIDLGTPGDMFPSIFLSRETKIIGYCHVALNLSKNGYFVFVSSHSDVSKKILSWDKNAIVCYPDASIKKEWIAKLYKRYKDMRNKETHNAWRRAKDHFDEDVSEMDRMKGRKLVIRSTDYNLKKMIADMI